MDPGHGSLMGFLSAAIALEPKKALPVVRPTIYLLFMDLNVRRRTVDRIQQPDAFTRVSADHPKQMLEGLEEMHVAESARIEKFAPSELAALQVRLMKLRSDSWQAAELVSGFLAGRGYGVDSQAMRTTVAGLAVLRGSHDAMQSLLETVAYVM